MAAPARDGGEELSDVTRITEIAEAAAERAVQKTLLLIGVDLKNPIEAQQDFSTLRDVARMARTSDFRKDLEHARTSRLWWESVRDKGTLISLGILITAILSALWAGIKGAVK